MTGINEKCNLQFHIDSQKVIYVLLA